jgi:hypothetical protein
MASQVTFRAQGAISSGSGAVSPALPSGMSSGDIVILVACTIAGGSCSITTNGSITTWNAIDNQDIASGEKIYVWWGRWSSGTTAPTVTPGSDHCIAGTMAFYNCSANNPLGVQAKGSETPTDSTLSFATGITSTVNKSIAIFCGSSDADSTQAQYNGTFANTSVGTVTTRLSGSTNNGGGGGIGCCSAPLATAGSVGTWTMSALRGNNLKAYISFVLQPNAELIGATAGVAAGSATSVLKGKGKLYGLTSGGGASTVSATLGESPHKHYTSGRSDGVAAGSATTVLKGRGRLYNSTNGAGVASVSGTLTGLTGSTEYIRGQIGGIFTLSDDFESYTAGALGGQGNWVTIQNTTRVIDVSGDNRIYTDVTTQHETRRSETFSDDQFAQCVIDLINGEGSIGVTVRSSGSSSATRYGFIYYQDAYTSYLSYGLPYSGGASIATGSRNYNAGDVLRLEIEGSELRAYVNGSLNTALTGGTGIFDVSSIISSNPALAHGSPGVSGWSVGAYGDDWQGGNLFGSPCGATVSGTLKGKRFLLSNGANHLLNGTFDSSTGWTPATGWTISGNVANYLDTNNSVRLIQYEASMRSVLKISTTYIIKFILAGATGAVRIGITNSDGSMEYIGDANYTNGPQEVEFGTWSNFYGNPADLAFWGYTDATNAYTIDNVEIREKIGYATVSGTLKGKGRLYGASDGVAALTGVLKSRYIVGRTDGVATVSGTLKAKGSLYSAVIGSELITQDAWYTLTYWDEHQGNWSQSGNTLASNGSSGALGKYGIWTIGNWYRVFCSITLTGGGFYPPYSVGYQTDGMWETGTLQYHYLCRDYVDMYAYSQSFLGNVTALSCKQITYTIGGISTVSGTLYNATPTTAAGTIDGITALTGVLKGRGRLYGSTDGVVALTGVLKSRYIVGRTDGVATASATLKAKGRLYGATNGVALLVADLNAEGVNRGSSDGVAALIGVLKAKGRLYGTTAGVALVGAIINGKVTISGRTDGVTSLTGVLKAKGRLYGQTTGVALVGAKINGAVHIAGSTAGVTLLTADLNAKGRLYGATNGITALTADLNARGKLYGATNGVADCSLTGLLKGYVTGTTAGIVVVSGSLVGSGKLQGYIWIHEFFDDFESYEDGQSIGNTKIYRSSLYEQAIPPLISIKNNNKVLSIPTLPSYNLYSDIYVESFENSFVKFKIIDFSATGSNLDYNSFDIGVGAIFDDLSPLVLSIGWSGVDNIFIGKLFWWSVSCSSSAPYSIGDEVGISRNGTIVNIYRNGVLDTSFGQFSSVPEYGNLGSYNISDLILDGTYIDISLLNYNLETYSICIDDFSITDLSSIPVIGLLQGDGALIGQSNGSSEVSGNTFSRYIVGSSSGVSVLIATLKAKGRLAGTIDGVAYLVLISSGVYPAHGAADGVAVVSATLKAKGRLYGTTNGVTLLTVNIRSRQHISATTAGVTLLTGVLKGRGKLYGSTSGVAATSATLKGHAALQGVTNGSTIVTATARAKGRLSGSSDGVTLCAATLKAKGKLIGSTSGVTAVSGTAYNSTPSVSAQGQTIGVTALTGVLKGKGRLYATTNGVAEVSGSLLGLGELAGATGGTVSVSGTLSGAGVLYAQTDGVASASATLRAKGRLVGATNGVATASGFIPGEDGLYATITGVTAVSGTLIARGRLSGSTSGVTALTNNIRGRVHIAGRSDGVATVEVIQYAEGMLLAYIICTSSVSAILHGHGKLYGTTAGVAAASGFIPGEEALTGQTDGVSAVSGVLYGTGVLQGLIEGVTETTCTAGSKLHLTGTIVTSSTLQGILLGLGRLLGQTDGITELVGDVWGIAEGQTFGHTGGIADVLGQLIGTGQLQGVTAGISEVVGIHTIPWLYEKLERNSYITGVISANSYITISVAMTSAIKEQIVMNSIIKDDDE